ncbi:pyridoxal-phosphate dependent enzyme [Chitinophaga sp. MM2321]|uniref:pyridoxal-phosphate dependent enzyme n=1 Tax=Chitinophaga sp. MM2321 TaxID=3137178 RepID=UPI0032D5860A
MNGIWQYGHLLSPIAEPNKITLGEGNTPLVKSRRLGAALGLDHLYFKLEITNPSGSYKDRFAAYAVADLLNRGSRFCLATSSGNTGAALAAYCAAADIKCFLAIVDGAPTGKLQQMRVYGAEIMMIKNFGKDFMLTKEVMDRLTAIAAEHNSLVQISAYKYCPAGMSGVQTISYELATALPQENKHVFSPAGGGGLTLAITEGFRIWKEHHPAFNPPRVYCVQPEGNDTISGALREGMQEAKGISRSETLISGLQVPNVLDGNKVIAGCRSSGGTGYVVADEAVYECQQQLATMEGIYCEPAGAVALAGLKHALHKKEIDKKDHIICIVSGHGFKDPASTTRMADKTDAQYFNTVNETIRFINAHI